MKLKLSAAAVFATALVIVEPAFAGTEFLAYERKNSIHEGSGGNKKVVNGVDFWMSGDPPRRFQVLGSIDDKRHKTGLFGMVRMATLDSDIARLTKTNGGNAVILSAAAEDLVGVASSSSSKFNGYAAGGVFNANSSGFGIAHPTKNHVATYVAVRYLPEAPTAAAVSSNAPAAPAPRVAPVARDAGTAPH